MIIWKFKGTDTKFRSTPASHQRDIFKMSKACGVPPETEIIYEHGKPNGPAVKDVFAVNSDTSDSSQPAVPKATKTRKPRRKKTTSMPDVSSDMDESNPISDDLESGSESSDTDSSLNGLAD